MSPITEFKDLSEEEAKNKVFAQKLKFNKGTKYDYNQTNFWLLHQKIIEKVNRRKFNYFYPKKSIC